MRYLAALGVIVIAGWGALVGFGGDQPERAANPAVAAPETGEMVVVDMPALTGRAEIGQRVFADMCAACHGPNAGGLEGKGPPLIHKIYEASHHADMAFVLAAQNGVVAHHWRFGDMPPVEGITEAEIAAVIDFIRTVQRANGIE